MKKLFSLLLVTCATLALTAQEASLEKAITGQLTLLDSAKTLQDVQAVVNGFQRIVMAEQARWEPLYYQAYAQITLSFWEQNTETRDKILDQAEAAINKAMAMPCDQSELHALLGFLYQGRIMANGSRALTYSMKAREMFEQAIQENPANPRAYYLMGLNVYHTPEGFGGGCINALPLFEQAKEKYEKEQGRGGIAPSWGAQSNNEAIVRCNNEK